MPDVQPGYDLQADLHRDYLLLRDIARNARTALEQGPEAQRQALREIAEQADAQVWGYEQIYGRGKDDGTT